MALRTTKQKRIIQEEIVKFSSFFSAEDLWHKVVKKSPKLGLATIYRFLKTRVKERELHSYTCSGRIIYSANQNNHVHFHCQKCGEVKHLELKKVDFLPPKEWGSVCHFQVDLTGTCDLCLRKEIKS